MYVPSSQAACVWHLLLVFSLSLSLSLFLSLSLSLFLFLASLRARALSLYVKIVTKPSSAYLYPFAFVFEGMRGVGRVACTASPVLCCFLLESAAACCLKGVGGFALKTRAGTRRHQCVRGFGGWGRGARARLVYGLANERRGRRHNT